MPHNQVFFLPDGLLVSSLCRQWRPIQIRIWHLFLSISSGTPILVSLSLSIFHNIFFFKLQFPAFPSEVSHDDLQRLAPAPIHLTTCQTFPHSLCSLLVLKEKKNNKILVVDSVFSFLKSVPSFCRVFGKEAVYSSWSHRYSNQDSFVYILKAKRIRILCI